MASGTLSKTSGLFPSVFNDLFKPWDTWFNESNGYTGLTVPAVNISEGKESFRVSMAAPGLKKNDFKIEVEGNMLSISAETSEEREEKDSRFTRKEYNFSSFSRSFTLPDSVNSEKIEAKYDDGVLKLTLPKKDGAQKSVSKQIQIK